MSNIETVFAHCVSARLATYTLSTLPLNDPCPRVFANVWEHLAMFRIVTSLFQTAAILRAGLPWVDWMFETSSYPHRWHLDTWPPWIGWLHILSDLATSLAFLAIPLAFVYFACRQNDLPFKKLVWLFSALIVACGTMHLLDAIIFWWPAYGLAGVIKFITACLSVATVVALFPVIPKALAYRSPEQLEREVERRTRALEASRRQAIQVVEASPSGMLMIDREGGILMVNLQVERMFGYSREELLGQTVEMLIPERFHDAHPGHRQRFFDQPQARTMGVGRDLFGRRKDGSEFPVELGLNPIETNVGLSVLASIVDISERKRLENRFRLAVEAAPSGMLMINQLGKIILVNNQLEQLFGYAREELIGQPVEVLLPRRFRADHPAKRNEYVAHPDTRLMGSGRDLFGQRKDGSEFPVEVGLNPIHTTDGVYVLSAVVDITERVEGRKQLEAYASELQRSNHELEQFAYIASHDLQEPLRHVVSCCQALAEDYAEKLDEDANDWIAGAVAGAQRMRRLVADLLAYSRVGTRGTSPAPTDAQSACEEVIESLSPAIEESGAQVHCGRLPQVMADDTQILQLFQNFIGNAIKYRGDAPPVIEVGADPLASNGNGENMWRFYVKDNGIGIEKQYFERIFVIFERLHSRERYSGTGVGLAICKKIVERLGGKLWVDSEVGEGSTFFFTLPAANEHPRGDQCHEGKQGAPSLTAH